MLPTELCGQVDAANRLCTGTGIGDGLCPFIWRAVLLGRSLKMTQFERLRLMLPTKLRG